MSIALAAFSLSSCNDYQSAAIGYEEVPTTPSETTAEHPKLESSWLLNEVINVGQHNANVFVYSDNLFNNLFARTLGWNGGEVQASFMLPGKGLVFVVRGCYFGTVNASTRARVSGNEVRNGLLLLTENHGSLSEPSSEDLYSLNEYVQTTDPDAEGYYEGVPLLTHSSSTRHYWPGVAAAYDGKIQVQWVSYRSTLGRRETASIYSYSTNGKPGDAGYLQVAEQQDEKFSNLIAYDDCLWQDDDGHNYMYCAYQLTGVNGVLVARSNTHDLMSEWEYCVVNTAGQAEWVSEIPTASATGASDEALRSNRLQNNAACQHPQVFKKGEYYYLVGQSYSNKLDVRIWRSKNPDGPFENVKTLCVLPSLVNKFGNQAFNELTRVVVHPALSRSGEIVLSTAQTAPVNNDNYTYAGSADFVRPYFFRIYNWEQLFK